MMNDVFIYDGIRSPIGRHGGALSGIRPDDLLAKVIRGLLDKYDFPESALEDVVMGCACQAGEDARNVARNAALLAGIPVTVSAQTQNRLCGSGLSATIEAARAIKCGDADLILAGGVESMSRAPFVMSKADSAFSRNVAIYDSSVGARFPNPVVEQEYGADSMPETADNIARDIGVTRDESDAFAFASQQKYQQAKESGFFADEILPIEMKVHRKKPAVLVEHDEHPRPDVKLEKLQSMSPLFSGGVVTAANASGINDGAAALLLGSEKAGLEYGLTARAKVLSYATAGVEPRLMGLGPVPAITKALQRADLTLADMDVIEINEAFATQVLGCLKQLGLEYDDPRVNPNGGAVSLGHPLGASGARLALTAIRQLEKTQGRYAVVSLCIGLGQGVAMVIERCD